MKLLTDLTGKTKMACVLGNPVKHSMSPIMYNTAIDYLNLDFVYLAFELAEDDIEKTVAGLRAMDVAAFNLTMPFKKTVIPFIDEISKEAEMIGSVNTVINENGKFKGYNTDGMGFVNHIKSNGVDIASKKIVIVGIGGAGRSIAIQMGLEKTGELVLMANNMNSANSVHEILLENGNKNTRPIKLSQENLENELKDADILINCTCVGMGENSENSIIEDEKILRSDLVVADIIYHPHETKLLKQAKNRNCKVVQGVGMLYHQGAIAFKLWAKEEMPLEYIMEKIKI